MIGLDPSPWLLMTVPFLLVVGYICHRGFTRNEFRTPGKNGWVKHASGSPSWYLATFTNMLFLGCGIFMLYMTVFDGTGFSREPKHPMPALSGKPIETLNIPRAPEALARCLADLDHGQIYQPAGGHWRVAVRNGRNNLMYIFEIVPAGDGSRLEVYRLLPSPFVDWNRCRRAD